MAASRAASATLPRARARRASRKPRSTREEYERDLREAEVARAFFAGDRGPDGAADHLAIAYALRARGEDGRAVPHFEAALADPAIRADLVRGDLCRGNLYAAAATALKASRGGSGEEQARLRALALQWLAADLGAWRAGLAAGDESRS
jgi:hypothetical protein